MDPYAFLLHPWFQATGPVGFYVYAAARAYSAELQLPAIPVKAMIVLVPHLPRPQFNDTVKALIAAGAFRRLEHAIEVAVPVSHLSQGHAGHADDVPFDDVRRKKERDRKARYRAGIRRSSKSTQAQNGTVPRNTTGHVPGTNGTEMTPLPGIDLSGKPKKSSKNKINPPTPQGHVPRDTTGHVPGTADGTARSQQIDALVQTWNTNCGKLPKVRAITSNRQRAFRLALEAHPDLNDWARGARFLTTQTWAMGGSDGHQNWFATLDYLVKPGKLAAALEKADALSDGLKPALTGTAAGRVTLTEDELRDRYAHLNDPDYLKVKGEPQ